MINFQLVKELNTSGLARTELGTSLDFTACIARIVDMQNGIMFFETRYNQLSEVKQGIIDEIGTSLVNFCQQISRFSQENEENIVNAQARRNEIIVLLKDLEKEFLLKILPLINDIKINESGQQEKERIQQLDNKVSTLDTVINEKAVQFDQKIRDAQNAVEQTNQLIQEANKFSSDQLIDKYGPVFEHQAKKNMWTAIASLIAFILFTIAGILLAIYLFKPLLDQLKEFNENGHFGYIISNIIFRLTLLSIILLFIKESLKNFNVNMNLYNLNKHRQNSLLSFNTFIGTTNDENTKNMLIKEIAKTIYSTGQIGYLSEEKKGFNLSQITEILKLIGK